MIGYDKDNVYINDPLHNSPMRKVNRKNFEVAWVQMGNQAIGYLPETTKYFFDTRNHWAKLSIDFVRKNNLMTRYNDYYFAPNDPLTRSQVAITLDRILKEQPITERFLYNFQDIENASGK